MMIETELILDDIYQERRYQNEKWGAQRNIPDGTGSEQQAYNARYAKERCDRAFADGKGTWSDILFEEVEEAFAESDQAKLRAELVQVAAVAAAWIEDIDTR